LFEAVFLWDRFAELIECFEVERQRLFGMRDGLFVSLTPRIAAFERRKIGRIAIWVALDRETICSRITFISTLSYIITNLRKKCKYYTLSIRNSSVRARRTLVVRFHRAFTAISIAKPLSIGRRCEQFTI
jgi:hypothetical protein